MAISNVEKSLLAALVGVVIVSGVALSNGSMERPTQAESSATAAIEPVAYRVPLVRFNATTGQFEAYCVNNYVLEVIAGPAGQPFYDAGCRRAP